MRLLTLELDRYRNISRAELSFEGSALHLIVGENGQGKTNLLSAIYWLATLTPLRTKRSRELVQWGEQACMVKGRTSLSGLTHQLEVGVSEGGRVARREGKNATTSTYFGALTVVSFTPSDLDLVRGAPEERRRFLDRAIFNEQPAHLTLVLNYQRALDARNRLLRDAAPARLLRAYEETLAELGARLMKQRARYLHSLSTSFTQSFHEICGFTGSLAYKPAISVTDPLSADQSALQEQLCVYWEQHRASDLQRGFTQRGPQSDDISLRLNERSAKAYASQGQQRAFALALKISQIELLSERLGERPVLLLDDVSSEFDERRATLLFQYLERFDGQVFLTTTHERHIPTRERAQVWRVQGGQLSAEG